MIVVGHRSVVVGIFMFRCVLLFVACFFVICPLSFAVRCVLFVVCCLVFVVRGSLFVV